MFELKKSSILKNKKLIMILKKQRCIKTSIVALRFVFTDEQLDSKIKVLFFVPKKNIRKAVDRNLIRRRLKECYRILKTYINNNFKKTLLLEFIYCDKVLNSYVSIKNTIIYLICHLNIEIEKNKI